MAGPSPAMTRWWHSPREPVIPGLGPADPRLARKDIDALPEFAA